MTKTKATAGRLKIGFVFDDSLDKNDGVQQYILGLGRYYKQLGHKVHYLVGQTNRTDLANVHSLSKNVKVSFNGNKMTMPLPASKKRIKKLLLEQRFDVLHVQLPYSPFMAGRVIKAAPKITKIIGTFHILPNSKLVIVANRLLRLLLLRSLKRIDQIVSVSPAAQEFLLKNWGMQSIVVPNIVDVKVFIDKKSSAELAESLNINFLGRLVTRKGCLDLLEAIKHIVRLNLIELPFKVNIGGKGPLGQNLKSFVSHNGLSHIVSFIGFVDEKSKPAFLTSADIAVYPSNGGESFGIVLIEAMAASRGVVLGGDNPGYRSVLGDQEGQLFNPKDTHEFALLLVKYLKSSSLRLQANKWQRQDVMQYDVPVVAERLISIYKD